MGRRAGIGFLGAVVVGVHIWVGLAMRAPIIHPDESGSLSVARFLAGQGFAPQSEHLTAYSVLLTPVAWLTSSPLALWRGALVVNAVLAGLTVILAMLLARRLAPEISERTRLVVVTVVAAYPAYFLWSNLAVSENLAVPLFLATVLLAWRAWESTRSRHWLLAGMAAGSLYAAHRHGIVVAVALGVIAFLWARPLADYRRRLAALVGGIGAVVGGTWVLAQWTTRADPTSSLLRPVSVKAVADEASGNVAHLAAEVAGQVWYLSVASWGLFPLGLATSLVALVALVRGRPGHRKTATPEAATLGLVALSVVAMVVASALSVDEVDRIDHLILGRDNEAILLPVLLVGLLGVVRLGRLIRADPPWARPATSRTGASWGTLLPPLVVVASTLAVSGAGLVIGRGAKEIELPVVRSNVLGLDVLLWWQDFRLPVLAFSAVALVAALVIVGLARSLPVAAAAMVGLLFVPSLLTGRDFMVDGSRQRTTERVVADAVRAVRGRLAAGAPRCVAYDVAHGSAWHQANYELFLSDSRLRAFSSRRGQRPCSSLVISGRPDFEVTFPGSRRVILENDYEQALWALPGPVQDGLGEAGWLLPSRLVYPVPTGDRRYRIGPVGSAPLPQILSMRRGHRRDVDVAVTHAGGAAPWSTKRGQPGEPQAVQVGVRWYRLPVPGRPDGTPILDRARAELPRIVLPGQTVDVRVPLDTVAADGQPIPAATYLVRVDVVQDKVAWFEPVGRPFVFEVVVVDRVF